MTTGFKSTPIEISTYKLLKKINELVVNFPHKRKYTNGNKLMDLALNMYDDVKTANDFPGEVRVNTLLSYRSNLNKIEGLLRLAYEEKYITDNDYVELSTVVESIEKQQRAWYTATKNKMKVYDARIDG